MSDRLVAITPEGNLLTLLDDGNPEATRALDAHYESRTLTPEIMAAARGKPRAVDGQPDLRRPGPPDRPHLGSLRGTTLPSFRSPVAGLAPVHWNEEIPA